MTGEFIWDESEWPNLEAARRSLGQQEPVISLSDDDRQIMARARELGPLLRASAGDRDRLAGWLLAELVAIVERLVPGDG